MVWDKAPEPKIKSLAGATTAQLVAALDSDNLFWRQTAQRLLVDGGKADAADALKAKIKGGGPAAIHAMWSLSGLGSLDRETHQLAMLGKDPSLRRNAIAALGTDADALQLFSDAADGRAFEAAGASRRDGVINDLEVENALDREGLVPEGWFIQP